MVDIISFEEIRKAQNLERDQKALQQLETEFFEKVRDYLSNKKNIIEENKDKDNIFSKETVEKTQYELSNINKILNDLCNRRQRKIALQALTNIAARVHNTENMLPEEEELYNNTLDLLKKYKDTFMKKFCNEIEKEPLKRDNDKLKLVRINDDIPSFVWKDGNTYGPCIKEDVINLPVEIADLLVNENKAIEIIIDNK